MMKRPTRLIAACPLLVTIMAYGQQITTTITGTQGKPALAVPQFKGAGSQQFMGPFNTTLFADLESSGLFDMRARSLYPAANPQQPADLRVEDNRQGFALYDWSGSPVGASHLVFGYTAAQNGVLVLYGYVYDARQQNPQAAQVLAQRYVGSLDEAGALKVAHEFANDIIERFGGTGSLLGSRIYYSSNRSGHDEIWAMDWDGANQKQLTHLGGMSLYPAVSPDGSRVAFTTLSSAGARLVMADTSTGRAIPFASPRASVNANASFTPDGKTVYFASTAGGSAEQIFSASAAGGQGLRRILYRKAVVAEPKVNPKNPSLMLFVSGPGPQQIYRMSSDGAGIDRVTNGQGEASNPSWSPDGEHMAFAWTQGYAKGAFNIFVMDVGTRSYVQLTHNEGKNENPVWAPDGRRLVFMSNRGGREQIYTMLADGSQVKLLTMQGTNRYPVWGVK
ncbi:MAG: translocation protein TolB [Bryobacteraceae bacterium]|jgi:TolB protein